MRHGRADRPSGPRNRPKRERAFALENMAVDQQPPELRGLKPAGVDEARAQGFNHYENIRLYIEGGKAAGTRRPGKQPTPTRAGSKWVGPHATDRRFSAALLALKHGEKITRQGWNAGGQWVELVDRAIATASRADGLA